MMTVETYYKDDYTYVKVCDRLRCKESKLKGNLLNHWDEWRLQREKEKLKKELLNGE